MRGSQGGTATHHPEIPKQCRHVSYIQTSFLAKVLKLEETEVVNEEKHKCFIPTCPGKVYDDLKEFFSVGNPPMNTYHPINYIGIGIHNDVDTTGWYTAYVPIHIQSFGNDIYKLNRALLRLIDGGVLWMTRDEAAVQHSHSSVTADISEIPDDRHGSRGIANAAEDMKYVHGKLKGGNSNVDNESNHCNVFRAPFTPLGVTDPNRYIFATPSCMYATMPEVTSPLSFKGLPVNLRVIIEVMVKPFSYTIGGASIPNVDTNFDSCFPNDAIEWYIDDVRHVIPQRILFRIMKKDAQDENTPAQASPIKSDVEIPVKLPENQSHTVDLIAVMPPANLLFVTENNFQDLRGIYSNVAGTDNAVTFQEVRTCGTGGSAYVGGVSPRKDTGETSSMSREGKHITVVGKGVNSDNQEPEFLIIKIKWTEHNNKVIFYLKSLINTKWLLWDSDSKVWRVNRVFLYECVKFALYLGLGVCDKVLFAAWSWLQSINMRGLGEIFSKTQFIQWMNTNKIWSFQRVKICIVPGFNPTVHRDGDCRITPAMQALARENAETVEIHLIPFNKAIVSRFKTRNVASPTYLALEDLLKVHPNLKEMSQKDTYLSSRGINLRDLNRMQKRSPQGQLNAPLKRVSRDKEDESDSEEFTTVSNLILTAAGKGVHLMRLKDKIKNLIEKVEPPSSSISVSGKIIHGGAGTGGIEFVEMPRGSEAWNKVSFCVVPDEHEGQIPVDTYDPNLLSSLVAEVFIIKESAIDYLLANFKRWPGPHDTISYTRWNHILTRNEPRCWGGESFDRRQRLAQTRLFCDEDFFITGNSQNSDAILCRLLIQLGNGKIVNNARDAEYVIITDKLSEEAQELNR
ncbi:hypothetical protein X943_001163 [Babesia divergens]|uniref:Uncharacterized protein n=1 Tax=Babesia divergens TaxID=32595 RepID=A0AAD9GFK8_BABDI|nr:hypothetical protein X943_001163 [Babesia divergens]